MKIPICPLGGMPADDFLKSYWQKQPLLVRQAFAGFESPISAEELAGLACEDEVHSRIVIEKGGEYPWQAIFGPMSDDLFAGLPDSHWTLLVNDAEKWLPELAWIVDAFRFIPEWRLDDLMVSYAPQGGSVGPHLDQYDTFILQAGGQRRWQISTAQVSEDNQVADTPLRIQKDFVAEQEWLLEPGDLIYIPPGVSHYGVALNDCLSYSIGFRAPTHAEMLGSFIDHLCQALPAELTYRDPGLKLQVHSNEITADALSNVREIFSHYLRPDHPELARWLGCFVSDAKVELTPENRDNFDTVDALLTACPVLARHPASRFAWHSSGNTTLLFVDGKDYAVSTVFAKTLCANREFGSRVLEGAMSAGEAQLLLDLYNEGKLTVAGS